MKLSLGIHISSTPQAFHLLAADMSAPVPRFLLPRGHLLPYTQLARPIKSAQVARHILSPCRNASASTSKPRVLEKPTKFNPPSHGKRLKQQVPRTYGPQLTGEQKTEQQTKKYPNMMPAEGTFMYWFLTSRGIHTFISLVRGYLKQSSLLPRLSLLPLSLSLHNTKHYTILNHPPRASSSSSPPSPPSKTGASPPPSANSSPPLPISSLNR